MIARFLQPCMPIGCELHADFQFDCTKACDLGFISLKLYELLQIFQSFGKTGSKVQCLIFVEQIITAEVIEIYVRKFGAYLT
ncbi:hypothetical protein ACFX13_005844 [Malus domestica]